MAKRAPVETETAQAPAHDQSHEPASTPAPSYKVHQRITFGGRGAKKNEAGEIVTPAEPTVEVFSGDFDLSPLFDAAHADAVRWLAASVVIDEASKALRVRVREAVANGVAPADIESASPEEVAEAIAAVLNGASDPFAPKAAKERGPAAITKAKAALGASETKREYMAKLAKLAGAAFATGDVEGGMEIQQRLIGFGSVADAQLGAAIDALLADYPTLAEEASA